LPSYSPSGLIETKSEFGFHDMISEINQELSKIAKDESSVYVYNFNQFVSKFGEKNIFDYRQFFIGDIKIAFDYIPYLANDLMGYVKPMLGLNKKCIVLDLDNTLWGGIVGEDEFDGIELGQSSNGKAFVEFQKHLLSLWQQGIILAINSKNNFEDAIKVIREHPDMVLKEEHFASLQINWNDKAQNLKVISEELNIGLGSIVYFDDDPVNQERIKQEIPEVLTVKLPEDPSQYTDILMSLNDFNVLQKTDEDLKRGKMYSQQRQRTELEQSTKSIDDFLKQLNIKVKIKKADKFTIPRISQLTLKTNQFNLTTKRYQEEDILKFSSDNNMIVGCAQIEDKFGDSGITNAFIIEKNDKEWKIDTFLLSCRIIGRGIEDAIISYILKEAKNQGVEKIRADFIPTKKNSPAEAFLPNCGFKKENEYWVYDLNNPIKSPNHLLLEVE
jgi:FkbH-like protein